MRTIILVTSVCVILLGCQSVPVRDPVTIRPAPDYTAIYEADTPTERHVHLRDIRADHNDTVNAGTWASGVGVVFDDAFGDTKPYHGNPPVGIFGDDTYAQKQVYHYARIEINKWGRTIIYDSDISKMTLSLEKDGKTWNMETQVSYAFCLDFITENLGKTSNFGFLLRKIQCIQQGLGKDF